MGKSLDEIRIMLIQIRERVDVARQEQTCFVERCGVRHDQIDAINVAHEPTPCAERVSEADVVMIGGAGAFSVTHDHSFHEPLANMVRRICEEGTPLFGVCWGHQFVAKILGGTVVNDDSLGEVGTNPVRLTPAGVSDPLFDGLPEEFLAHMGHHDYVQALPDGATELAVSTVCPNQAFRLDGAPIYGTQFHVELSAVRLMERLSIYQHIYVPDKEELDLLEQAPKDTPETDGVLRRFLEMYVVDGN